MFKAAHNRNLRARRVLAGFTIAQLAEKADINRGTLSDLELGKTKALPTTLEAIARVLGCTPQAITHDVEFLEGTLLGQSNQTH